MLTVFVTFSCDILHNDDDISKIASLAFCFLVDPASEIYTPRIIETTKIHRYSVYRHK